MSTGGPPANPLTIRACELLDDREWHELEAIYRELGKLVPPGKAVRRAEQERRGQRGGNAPAERVRAVSHERLIQFGRRSYARGALNTSARYFERKTDDDGVVWIRMLEVPPRVHSERSRARARHEFVAADICDELRGGADASALLGELSPSQLLRVSIELAKRERERGLEAERRRDELARRHV